MPEPVHSEAVWTRSAVKDVANQAKFRAWNFLNHADVFKISASLKELRARPKNTPDELEKARDAMDALRDQLPQVISTIVVDQDSNIILAYCANQLVPPVSHENLDNVVSSKPQPKLTQASNTETCRCFFLAKAQVCIFLMTVCSYLHSISLLRSSIKTAHERTCPKLVATSMTVSRYVSTVRLRTCSIGHPTA